MSRIYHELTIDSRDTHRADRSGERNIRDAKRGRGPSDSENIGIVLAVRAEKHADYLGIVKIAFRKQRAKRTIRHSRSQRLHLGGTTFALEITTGKFSNRRRLLAVVNGKREKILALLHSGS